jgi:hypothetical protein
MAAFRAGEVEVLLTVDDKDVARAEKNVKATGERIEKKPIKPTVDPADALKGMDRVEQAAKKLVSQDTAIVVNARIDQAEKNADRIQKRLDYLRSVSTELNVDADISRAERSLTRVQKQAEALKKARAEMVVEVDDGKARSKLSAVADFAGEAGAEGGAAAGANMGDGIINALTAIPIAGAVAGLAFIAARALREAFVSALQIEVRQDRLQALTGIDEASAAKFARAAGEAYANNFGESIESNMNTARLALQFDLIDEDATTRDAQKVISGLSGIADVLEEDVGRTATAVTTLLRTGLAKSAQDAYDLIAAGAQKGLNRNEDLLDTLTEYPVVLERLGISGRDSLGLISQAMQAGARNTDVAADALKEFQIRATDGSDASRKGFERLGFSAEEMTAKIAAGGEGAREGLAQVLDGLRAIEDPVQRNAAAVELFGTKAEDLGAALFAMDLNTAAAQFDNVAGAADRMFETIADNDASRIQQAQRNIEVAAQGIQGALASALSEPLGDFADWVSANRGPVLQFFVDLANGALDFAESATDGFGAFVSGPLAEMVEGIAAAIDFMNGMTEGKPEELVELADSMRGFTDVTDDASDAIQAARDRLNEFAEPQVALGYLNDASIRLASAIDGVGFSADGARIGLEGLDLGNLRASESGALLEDQIRGSLGALGEQVAAAEAAGESQTQLTDRYNTATSALVGQLTQMGLTEDQARALIDTVLQTPPEATTAYSSNAPQEQAKVQNLADRITTLPDGSVVITADTTPARNGLEGFIQSATGRRIAVYVDAYGGRSYQTEGSSIRYQAQGGVLEFMAGGGIPGLTPMSPTAQMVPANTWRVVGDRGDVPEAYVPLDGSARSWAILLEAMRRMPGDPGDASAGAPVGPSGPTPSLPPIQVIHNGHNYAYDPQDIARAERQALTRALDALPAS